jgi:hypothetical protein
MGAAARILPVQAVCAPFSSGRQGWLPGLTPFWFDDSCRPSRVWVYSHVIEGRDAAGDGLLERVERGGLTAASGAQ